MSVVNGEVAPGYERVSDAFAHADIGEGGATFTAYVNGRIVADLWGGVRNDGTAWAQDTVSTVMSATKGMAALCMQILWDRGDLDVDAEVARYWPEYAQSGKDGTLVRHFLTHTAGMLCFDEPGELLDWDGNGWEDYDGIADRIARTPARWRPGSLIGYHGISYGWLLQELVRRITGDTLGAFFAREVAGPLGVDIHIGTPLAVQERMADIVDVRDKPGLSGRLLAAGMVKTMLDSRSALAQASIVIDGKAYGDPAFLNAAKTRSAEIPAANGTANARALARVYAMLAQGGELDGARIVSPKSIELFRTQAARGRTQVWPDRGLISLMKPAVMRYALGYEGEFGEVKRNRRFGPSPSSFGHLGAGGQIGFADPANRVSGAFTRSHYTDNTASSAVIAALYESIKEDRP